MVYVGLMILEGQVTMPEVGIGHVEIVSDTVCVKEVMLVIVIGGTLIVVVSSIVAVLKTVSKMVKVEITVTEDVSTRVSVLGGSGGASIVTEVKDVSVTGEAVT